MAVAFLVDGFTEQRFIQLICPKKPVQRLNVNGNTVSAAAIAKRAATQIRLWGGKYFPIIIVTDLEDRKISGDAFAESIGEALKTEGIVDEIIISVADRMIENWILGDSENLGWTQPPASVDGINGAARLKSLIGVYDKAADGPRLLAAARASRIRTRSPSFETTFTKLIGVQCAWLAA